MALLLKKPAISIITTLDRDWRELTHPYIDALEHQQGIDSEDIELIVINSYDDTYLPGHLTATEASYRGGVTLNFQSIRICGRAEANNYAISQSQSDILLLLANDFIASPKLVADHLALHADYPQEHHVGIGPSIFPPELETTPFMHWLEESGQLFGMAFAGENANSRPAGYFYGGNTSLKRSFIEKAGLFDEDYPYFCWDDYELGIRLRQLGMESHFLPDSVAFHWHEISVADRRFQMKEAGESAAIMDFKQGGTERLQAGIRQRRKTRNAGSKDIESRWTVLLFDDLNKAYKNAAKRMLSDGRLK